MVAVVAGDGNSFSEAWCKVSTLRWGKEP